MQAAALAVVCRANWAARRAAAAADDCWANADRVNPPAWAAWRPAKAAEVEHVRAEPQSCWPTATGRSSRASTWRPCPAAACAAARWKSREREKIETRCSRGLSTSVLPLKLIEVAGWYHRRG